MKRTEAEQVGDIINEVFRRAGQTDNACRHRALAMWSEVVGQGVNRQTTRRYVTEQGVMHVFITSAALKSDLSFMKSQIIKNLNDFAGKPDAIVDLIIH